MKFIRYTACVLISLFSTGYAAPPVLETVLKLGFVEFSGLFCPRIDSFSGGYILLSILPPEKESILGQKNPKIDRTQFENSLLAGQPVLVETANILKERLKKAKSGDFFVAEANKMVSLLIVRSITPASLILEEITAPASALNPRPASWSDWIKKRAPGHTSWSMIEIDLQSHQLLECYSFTRSAWMQLSTQDSLIPTLLSLPLKPVAENNLRRIGPHPMDGEADRRQVWKPPLIIQGAQVLDAEFNVFEALWPQDGSQLAGNKVSIYFDRMSQTPFPAWIQIETAHADGSLRIIDAGKGLPALHRKLPRRVPEFIGSPQKTETGMRLSLKSPKYYRSFDLFAIDVTTREKQLLPITHSLVSGDGEVLQIEIDMEELQQMLIPDHRYTWLLVPNGYSESYTESTKSFLWKSDP